MAGVQQGDISAAGVSVDTSALFLLCPPPPQCTRGPHGTHREPQQRGTSHGAKAWVEEQGQDERERWLQPMGELWSGEHFTFVLQLEASRGRQKVQTTLNSGLWLTPRSWHVCA